ncbi:DUF4097 family beta strand repeat-containing protein [Liquorilactobacillus oeni]|nr:DUF4097 family beta strand repeat-containing protein [Liquorilactobacillus oeni]
MKTILIWLGFFIVILLLVGGGFALWAQKSARRIDVNSLKFEKLQTSSRSLSPQLQNIELKVRTARIFIEEGTKPKVDLENIPASQFKVTAAKQQLIITQKDYFSHRLELGKSATIRITLPAGKSLEELSVDQLNGLLKLNKITVQDLTIDHRNGTSLGQNLILKGSGEVKKRNGTTVFNNLAAPGLKVSIKTGTFKLNGQRKAASNQNYDDHQTKQLKIVSGTGQVRVTTR